MSKMTGFKYFGGTKQEFITKGLATTHKDAIVFIKGGSDAKQSCIFAQGMYFANFSEFLAAINYVKGVKVGSSEYVATAGGGYIPFASDDNSTVSLTVANGTITVGLTEAFVTTVNSTATNLGSKTDAADKDGSAFARIANLAALVSDLTGGSTDSIEGQINNAINALREEIVGDLSGDEENSKTLEEINAELDGIDSEINDIRTTFATTQNLEDSVALVQGKSTDASTATTIYGAKKYAEEKAAAVNTALEPRVKANEDAIAVLNGNDTTTGSVDKKIKDAINAFAGSADSDNVIENVTELLNYVSGVDGSKDLADALAQIEENKGKIETLNGTNTTAGSVAKQVKDAIDAEVSRADGAYATKAQGAKADTAYQKPSTGIPTNDIAQDAITTDKIAPESVTFDKLETNIAVVVDNAPTSAAASDYISATIEEHVLTIEVVTEDPTSEPAATAGLATAQGVRDYVNNAFEWEEL